MHKPVVIWKAATVTAAAVTVLGLTGSGVPASGALRPGAGGPGRQTPAARSADGSPQTALRVAALGDSGSSGEGAGSYFGGACHRSPHAWPFQLARQTPHHRVRKLTRS